MQGDTVRLAGEAIGDDVLGPGPLRIGGADRHLLDPGPLRPLGKRTADEGRLVETFDRFARRRRDGEAERRLVLENQRQGRGDMFAGAVVAAAVKPQILQRVGRQRDRHLDRPVVLQPEAKEIRREFDVVTQE
jgi:hypothetical protein